ncbi:MAG: zf-HC2 domain-containing protein [Clostridiales bacterium]|nr:zf-HC2 domain-containing protein [Clostridiales bacterium]
MDCENVKKSLSLYIDDELEQNQIEEIEEHLGICEVCMHECEDLLKVAMLLRTVPEAPLPDGFDKRLRAAIRDEKDKDNAKEKEKEKEKYAVASRTDEAPVKAVQTSRAKRAAAARSRWRMVSGLAAVFVIGIFSIIVYNNMDVFVPSSLDGAGELMGAAAGGANMESGFGSGNDGDKFKALDESDVSQGADDGSAAADGGADVATDDVAAGDAAANDAAPTPQEEQEAKEPQPPQQEAALVDTTPAGYVDLGQEASAAEPANDAAVEANRSLQEPGNDNRDKLTADYYLKRLADGLAGYEYNVTDYTKVSDDLWVFYVDITLVDEVSEDEIVKNYLYFGQDGALWRENID